MPNDERRQSGSCDYIVTRYIVWSPHMSAIEEHKPTEKRRALGRGLDSLLPSGPRLATAVPAPAIMPPPIVIPTAPSSVPDEGKGAHAAAHQQFTPRPSFDGAPNADAVQQIAL